jgi:hypothetical protein
MKYIVPINLKSIKKNLDAGKTTGCIPTGMDIVFKAKEIPAFWGEDGKDYVIESISSKIRIENNIEYKYEGSIINPLLVDKCKEQKVKGVFINIKYNYATIEHFPEPLYLYTYKDIKIKCDYCKKIFKASELKVDSGDCGSFSATICPKCGQWDCCDIKYENIKEALKRTNIIF